MMNSALSVLTSVGPIRSSTASYGSVLIEGRFRATLRDISALYMTQTALSMRKHVPPLPRSTVTVIHPGEGCDSSIVSGNGIRKLPQNMKIVATHTDNPDNDAACCHIAKAEKGKGQHQQLPLVHYLL
ncbi:hypothetical protein C5167_029173 [Papaver somniferum]|nr:hypothetical protein C5167_029173 [Papaver somniferum]